jgi:hypothetical protein
MKWISLSESKLPGMSIVYLRKWRKQACSSSLLRMNEVANIPRHLVWRALIPRKYLKRIKYLLNRIV